jgi:hypothetical protein
MPIFCVLRFASLENQALMEFLLSNLYLLRSPRSKFQITVEPDEHSLHRVPTGDRQFK